MLSYSHSTRRALPSLALAALGLISSASAQETRATAVQTLSAIAVPAAIKDATVVSRVTSSKVLSISVSLAPSSRAAFEAYANGVSDPKSATYHRFLTPVQIGQRFGASASTVNATVAYLKSKGLSITMIGDNHMAVLAKGRADKIESAFSTKLYNYRAVGRALTSATPAEFFSYSTQLKLPKTFASQVVNVGGLENAYRPLMRSTLTPAQTLTLYKLNALSGTSNAGGRKGEGVNLAITNFDGYRLSNLPLFYSSFGLAVPSGGVGSNVRVISVDGFNGENETPQGEGDLDIQLALGMAPRSNLLIYDANDFVALAARQAQDDLADIVTESYGHFAGPGSEPGIQAAHDQHVAMTVQGITYLLATGDYGTDLTAGSGTPFDYPNFDPEILQIGGTVATVDGAGNRITEDGWNGSGSGWSTYSIGFNVLPAYQKGTGVPTNINRRLFPDLSLHADDVNKPVGEFGGLAYSLVLNGQVTAISGTSASSPVFAGQLAIVLQTLKESKAADASASGRPRLGRINDLVYELDGDPAVFFDTLTGDAGPLPDGSESLGGPDWDFVTGFGAPDVTGLYTALLASGSEEVARLAQTQLVYTTTIKPFVQLGDILVSDGALLAAADDGFAMNAQSRRQSGVGQVAAISYGFALQNSNRRGASVAITATFPRLTTGFVYLYNYPASASALSLGKPPVYDVVATTGGDGTAKTFTVPVDLTQYLNPNDQSTVTVLVRALKPTRLGATPFVMSIDKLVVNERVPRVSTPAPGTGPGGGTGGSGGSTGTTGTGGL